MSFPILGVCFHFTSAMENSYEAHLPLDALVFMILGVIEADPCNLGTYTESWESHRQFTIVYVELSFDGHRLVHLQLS